MPVHIAIIMDGNGRWARAQGKERLEGHFQGYTALKEAVYAADDLGVQYLTVYGFSSENWRRPTDEVEGLMRLMAMAMQAELEELIENDIRIRTAGRMQEVPAAVREIFAEAAERTQNNTQLCFTLAINYGGRAEIVDAVRQIVESVQRGEISPAAVTEETIAAALYHPETPDPDLLIRTAGEMRLSNFLLWETAYSELHITPTPWPAFTRESLVAAIADYQKRVRKFGAVVE